MKEWRARQEPPVSQAGLGEKIGLSFMQVWRIENGVADPRLKTMERLQELGVCSVADWATPANSDTPPSEPIRSAG